MTVDERIQTIDKLRMEHPKLFWEVWTYAWSDACEFYGSKDNMLLPSQADLARRLTIAWFDGYNRKKKT